RAGHPRYLPSFPTRRSSDLDCQTCASCTALRDPALNRLLSLGREVWTKVRAQVQQALTEPSLEDTASLWLTPIGEARMHAPLLRSEEHTSELQSRENLVCRL